MRETEVRKSNRREVMGIISRRGVSWGPLAYPSDSATKKAKKLENLELVFCDRER
jgi:hypothetical protein